MMEMVHRIIERLVQNNHLLSSIGLGLIVYFLFMFMENIYDMSKKIRFVIALGVGIGYYYYGVILFARFSAWFENFTR